VDGYQTEKEDGMSTAEEMVREPEPVEAIPSSPVDLDEWCEWKLRQIAAAQQEIERNRELAERERAKIDRWLDDANAGHETRVSYLTTILQQAARAFPFEGKKKSRKLISGTFGFRHRAARLALADEEAAKSFAVLHDIPLKVTEEVQIGALKEWWQSTGIVPAGTEVVPEAEDFYCEVK
jgi:hypothetical protein